MGSTIHFVQKRQFFTLKPRAFQNEYAVHRIYVASPSCNAGALGGRMTQARLRLPVVAFFVWAACTIPWSADGKPVVTAHISGRHTRADAVSHWPKPAAQCTKPRSPDEVEIERTYQVQRAKLDRYVDALLERGDISTWRAEEPGWRVWDLFPPIYTCPSKEKLGIQPGDGGKFVCGVNTFLQRSTCIALSFGSNGETSFEAEILNRTPCEVHTFDPTLDSEKRALVQRFPAIHLHEDGLGAEDGRAKLGEFDAEIKTLPTILDELQIHWVDLLKVDIEGAEWKVLESMLDYYNGQLPFTQLQIEFHLDNGFTTPLEAVSILRRLDSAGLRVFSTEYNFLGGHSGYIEYSFINVNECGVVEG